MTGTKVGGSDQLYPQVTIDALPDNVLLEIFEFHLDKDDTDEFPLGHDYDRWQKLVHVCRRWRCIVFASPRRLDLELGCTEQSANSKLLDIWPALPIVVWVFAIQSKEQVVNVTAALREHDRVRKISYDDTDDCNIQDSMLKEFAAIDEPFPALICLKLSSCVQNPVVLPDSFLGGSAPLLRTLDFDGIPYPSIGKLLLSATDLVRLSLWRIPHSGYLAPNTIVPYLSMLSRLESLALVLKHPRPRAHRASRHPPPLTRVVLANLTSLGLGGDIEYLEDILSQIETPMLNQSYFCFFNQLVFDTPLLGQYIRHTEIFTTIHTAHVRLNIRDVEVTLWGQDDDAELLDLQITCKPLDWQLSAVAQVLNSLLSSLPILESLAIAVDRDDWQSEIEVTQWLEFFRPFTHVKEMTLVREDAVSLVAPALQELAEETATEVLPALQELTLSTDGWQPSGPVEEAICWFIGARQLYGRPVTVYLH